MHLPELEAAQVWGQAYLNELQPRGLLHANLT